MGIVIKRTKEMLLDVKPIVLPRIKIFFFFNPLLLKTLKVVVQTNGTSWSVDKHKRSTKAYPRGRPESLFQSVVSVLK